MTTSVGGFYVRREERTPVCLTVSPLLSLSTSHCQSLVRSRFSGIFLNNGRRGYFSLGFHLHSQSPPCCTVYGSLLSKAMGKEDRGTEERNFMWILPSNHICWGTFAPLLTPPSFQESYLFSFFAGHVSRGLYLGSTGIEQQKLWGKKVPTPI